MKKKLLILFTLTTFSFSYSQQIKILNLDKPDVSFRGLSVVDNFVLWVSGTKGTVGLSYNGLKTINWVNPKGYESRDFRAIAALDPQTAIVVAIDSPGIILKTTDGGSNWKEVYRDDAAGVFMDAIDFAEYNPKLGIVVGDPVNGEPYVLKTVDAGDTWTRMTANQLPAFQTGEAFFAASNSNVKLLDETTFIAVTGGSTSHIMYNTVPAVKVPLPKDTSPTSGANALDYYPLENFGLIVGGDFENSSSSVNNLFIFKLKDMKTPVITQPDVPPSGYMSGVAIQSGTKAISCGLTGVFLTEDTGKTWTNLNGTAYHVCKKARNGKKIYLAGPNGRIGHLMD